MKMTKHATELPEKMTAASDKDKAKVALMKERFAKIKVSATILIKLFNANRLRQYPGNAPEEIKLTIKKPDAQSGVECK